MTKIEWVKNPDGTQGITLNPIKGMCPMACPYCYARRMYKRFGWNPEISFNPRWMNEIPKKPCRVFLGSTMELFGDWVKKSWLENILWNIEGYPKHTFIFLTKKPEKLAPFSPFPDNIWVGVSATNTEMALEAWEGLADIEAKVRFISFEPLQERILMKDLTVIDWVIIGAQTPYSIKTAPKIEWVKEIVEAADKARIPVFLKNNLENLVCDLGFEELHREPKLAENIFHSDNYVVGVDLRQEFPIPDEAQ